MKITICRDDMGLYSKDLSWGQTFDEDCIIRRMLKSQHIPVIKKGEELIVDLWFSNPRIKSKKGVGDAM